MITTRVIVFAGSVRGRIAVRALAGVAVLLVLPFTLAIDAATALGGRLGRHLVTRGAYACCPRGDRVGLVGIWTCPSCHLVGEGHAFAACGHCHALAYGVSCACGLPVKNPLWRPVKEE